MGNSIPMIHSAGAACRGHVAADRSAETAISLSPDQCIAARRLRRRGRNLEEIAASLKVSEDEVRQALATMRTRKQTASRRSLNVTLAAHEFVTGEAGEGEVCWETVDRLLIDSHSGERCRARLSAGPDEHGAPDHATIRVRRRGLAPGFYRKAIKMTGARAHSHGPSSVMI